MAFGIINTQNLDLLDGIDAKYLQTLKTRSGLKVTDLIQSLDSQLGNLNAGLDPLIARLLAPPTTEVTASGSRGERMKAQKRSEFTIARPQMVKQRAHMLAIDGYEITMGFTEDGLKKISRFAFDDNVRAMVEGWQALIRREALNRLFSAAEVPVDEDTTGTSPGFIGSGSGTNVFQGNYPDGSTATGSTHYFRDTSANRAVVIKAARAQLRKWRKTGFLELIGSQAFVDAVVALGAPDFIPSNSALINPGSGTTTANVDPTEYVGVFAGDIKVRYALGDFTEDNAALYFESTAFSTSNPLIMRVDEFTGRNVYVKSRTMFPLADATSLGDFGFNVNNRSSAALIHIDASGSYDAPSFPL